MCPGGELVPGSRGGPWLLPGASLGRGGGGGGSLDLGTVLSAFPVPTAHAVFLYPVAGMFPSTWPCDWALPFHNGVSDHPTRSLDLIAGLLFPLATAPPCSQKDSGRALGVREYLLVWLFPEPQPPAGDCTSGSSWKCLGADSCTVWLTAGATMCSVSLSVCGGWGP